MRVGVMGTALSPLRHTLLSLPGRGPGNTAAGHRAPVLSSSRSTGAWRVRPLGIILPVPAVMPSVESPMVICGSMMPWLSAEE